ncbi:MAG: hypothetical protein ACKV1O_10485, partial [Saprospiraceae bacterium]
RLFGLPFLPLTWAGFFVPLVVENQRYDTSPLFSLRPIHATKPKNIVFGNQSTCNWNGNYFHIHRFNGSMD